MILFVQMTTRNNKASPCALEGLRVLEVASPLTSYCGKMFADMGADVVLVEPPGGSRLRREHPFIADIPGVERSLAFAYYNTSKRGITLDLDREEGCTLFRRLAGNATPVSSALREPAFLNAWTAIFT